MVTLTSSGWRIGNDPLVLASLAYLRLVRGLPLAGTHRLMVGGKQVEITAVVAG